ncbi:ATP-binding cassette family protein [Streptomyces cinnamoneus]|uniref:Nuclease SbcCD subunit C n=1 Tax=Streptomyces cinnamoneus TaxID=53446 RepID=A0A2G1XN00_STRCJ|nr:SMC family ATPase [Streptomyces cinnamoneus]PHQ52596.1 ATP-binding cassette family protein [Streptomyces cinnamoneus]PPT16133.1 SMC family ATPase [Streptomyces cinnamoneus]
MRLHRLTVTAFGPFGGTEHVDFDELSAGGLFLLHGPTGAGKTSVLDAVCYALYNEVPGTRQGSGLTLRSDHAEAGTPTEVVLELTVAGRRLEITRRPEQLRPKKRGAGFTKEKPHSALRERPPGGDWKGLSRSHQEIGEEIRQLLGMSREQFCQVVLLPQGDFARFLRAEDTARGKLLRSLFGTGRFLAVEERLAELRREAEAQVREGDERLLRLGHRMRQAAADPTLPEVGVPAPATATPAATGRGTEAARTAGGVPRTARGRATVPGPRAAEPPLAPGDPGLAEAVLEWAALARTGARERQTVAEAAVAAAEQVHRAAHDHADEVRELARSQRRHAEAEQRAAALRERRPEHDEVRRRLERALAAEAVAPALELRDKAEAGLLAAAAAERRTRQALPDAHRDGDAGHLAAAEHALREELGALTAARRAEARAAGLVRDLAELGRAAGADEEVLAETGEWLDAWETTRRDHRQRIDAAQEAVGLAERLGGQLEPARRRLQAARRRDELAREVTGAETRLLAAREDAAAAREHWLGLKDRRLRGMAAELAAGLTAGEPCAVCGAAEHPAPARPAAGHVDPAAEEAALQAHQRAEAVREEAAGRLRSLREARDVATAEAGPAAVDELARDVAEVERSLAAARDASAGLHEARQALAAAEAECERRRAAQEEARLRVAARSSRREQLARELRALEEELEQARGGEESVARRAARLEERLVLLAGAAEAAREAGRAADRLKEADAQLADAAYRAGFDTPALAAEALLSAVERRGLQERLDRWRSEEAAVAAELADRALTEAAARPPADPQAAQAAADAATGALRRASAEEATARSRCEDLDRLSAEAEADARRLAPLRAEHHRVAELSWLAAGTSARNERKMRLESYVLAARLEQVAAAATARLQRMSAGRYTLVHSDARTSGRGRSGLGLHVVDSWTGRERDTATLSGGETFFASLALALGLADVVTQEAGGTRLDTLFIDEGFGSLDEQTLDEVLDVLDSLRERDRSVGIVSHVADLRRRIPAQLQVVKERSGSAVRHRTAVTSG